MDKIQIYEFLKNKNVPFEVTEHKAIYNMRQALEIQTPYPEYEAKNLFVRDDKKLNFYLITVKGDKRVNLKEFRKNNFLRPLSFASEQDLQELLNLTAGSVTPLGLFNDKNFTVIFYLDKEFLLDKALIGVHPNDNTATVWLKTQDLINLIEENGHSVNLVNV
ncbi:MAG TPA: prolyl-tRNA editing protein [Clostridiales bacterium]|nr:prolyl-tRNA editing protein [Clostridiales bacterium]